MQQTLTEQTLMQQTEQTEQTEQALLDAFKIKQSVQSRRTGPNRIDFFLPESKEDMSVNYSCSFPWRKHRVRLCVLRVFGGIKATLEGVMTDSFVLHVLCGKEHYATKGQMLHIEDVKGAIHLRLDLRLEDEFRPGDGLEVTRPLWFWPVEEPVSSLMLDLNFGVLKCDVMVLSPYSAEVRPFTCDWAAAITHEFWAVGSRWRIIVWSVLGGYALQALNASKLETSKLETSKLDSSKLDSSKLETCITVRFGEAVQQGGCRSIFGVPKTLSGLVITFWQKLV